MNKGAGEADRLRILYSTLTMCIEERWKKKPPESWPQEDQGEQRAEHLSRREVKKIAAAETLGASVRQGNCGRRGACATPRLPIASLVLGSHPSASVCALLLTTYLHGCANPTRGLWRIRAARPRVPRAEAPPGLPCSQGWTGAGAGEPGPRLGHPLKARPYWVFMPFLPHSPNSLPVVHGCVSLVTWTCIFISGSALGNPI